MEKETEFLELMNVLLSETMSVEEKKLKKRLSVKEIAELLEEPIDIINEIVGKVKASMD